MKKLLNDTLTSAGSGLTGVAAVDGVDSLATGLDGVSDSLGNDSISIVLKAIIVIFTVAKPLAGAVRAVFGVFRKKQAA